MPRDTSPADDRVLARAAASGDRRALEILLDRHFDLVHAVCRRVTGNPHDALDATQEALIAVVRRVGSYDGRARFTTWLYRVATNAALDEVRRRGRRPRPSDEVPETADRSFEAAADARLDVDAALANVPPDFRAAVTLRDLGGLEYSEIADILGVPVGTVRSRISRGRAAVAERLGSPEVGNRAPSGERPTAREP